MIYVTIVDSVVNNGTEEVTLLNKKLIPGLVPDHSELLQHVESMLEATNYLCSI